MRSEAGLPTSRAHWPISAALTRAAGYFWLRRYLYLMLTPALAFYLVFHYVPLYGATIAFKDFNVMRGIAGSEWVGFKHFEYLFGLDKFWDVFQNTLIISTYRLMW